MRITTLVSALCLLLLAAGCSDKAASPDPISTSQATPEAGEVPDEVMALLESHTATSLDPVPESPENGPTTPNWPTGDIPENCDVYSVTLLWGQFQGVPTTEVAPTDWSGKLWVNGVAVVHPRLTIDFEPETDSLIPTDMAAEAAWASHTSLMDFDGISFLVFLDKDITYIVAPTLNFTTEPFEKWFHFQDRFSALYTLDDGNGVAIHMRKIWPDRCPGGFLEGEWIREDNIAGQGLIEGLWIDYKGQPIGIMYGEFWSNDDGSREFSGYVTGYYLTYIIAEFKGCWWYDDPRLCPSPWCGTGHGWFRGNFVYANGTGRGGMLAGEIGHMNVSTDDVATLPYHGIWRDSCPFDEADIEADAP